MENPPIPISALVTDVKLSGSTEVVIRHKFSWASILTTAATMAAVGALVSLVKHVVISDEEQP